MKFLNRKIAKTSATKCIERFFRNKNLSFKEIFTDSNISLVATTEIGDACDCAYKTLETKPKPKKYKFNSQLEWDVQFVLAVIKHMKSLGIPKKYQGGLILLYLKYCQGYELCEMKTSSEENS